MTSAGLRDCECDRDGRYTNLSSILLMFKCASCGGVDYFAAVDIDKAISILTKMRATAFHGRVTAEGVQPAERPAD